MKPIYCLLLLLGLCAAVPPAAGAAKPDATPACVAQAYARAALAQDFEAAAAFVVPDTLAAFQRLVVDYFRRDASETARAEMADLFGVESPAALAALPPTTLFARMMAGSVQNGAEASLLQAVLAKTTVRAVRTLWTAADSLAHAEAALEALQGGADVQPTPAPARACEAMLPPPEHRHVQAVAVAVEVIMPAFDDGQGGLVPPMRRRDAVPMQRAAGAWRVAPDLSAFRWAFGA